MLLRLPNFDVFKIYGASKKYDVKIIVSIFYEKKNLKKHFFPKLNIIWSSIYEKASHMWNKLSSTFVIIAFLFFCFAFYQKLLRVFLSLEKIPSKKKKRKKRKKKIKPTRKSAKAFLIPSNLYGLKHTKKCFKAWPPNYVWFLMKRNFRYFSPLGLYCF